jgi:ethanolamine utilization protein EutA (predicted chaperonin)
VSSIALTVKESPLLTVCLSVIKFIRTLEAAVEDTGAFDVNIEASDWDADEVCLPTVNEPSVGAQDMKKNNADTAIRDKRHNLDRGKAAPDLIVIVCRFY